MENFPLWLFLVLLAADRARSFSWMSTHVLPDNVTVSKCAGENVTLPWHYSNLQPEHFREEEWHFLQDGGHTDKMLAARIHGQFVPEPDSPVQLEFIPNASVRLVNVSSEDSGRCWVTLKTNLHGSLVIHVQNAYVHVVGKTDHPDVVKNGHVSAWLQPGATLINTTQDYHLVLVCSNVNRPWRDTVTVQWTTPDNSTLPSTWSLYGQYFLAIPNPVIPGQYTCTLDNSSPPIACLASDSPLLRGATVTVDGVQARLALLEGQLQAATSKEAELENKLQMLESENLDLKQKLAFATQSIAFDVKLQTRTTSNQPLFFTDVITNQGNAFDRRSAKFVAPVNGTYSFHLTLTSTNPIVDNTTVTAWLVVDDQPMVKALTATVAGYYDTGSVDMVKILKEDQKVWVVNESDGQHHFAFSVHLVGMLLRPAFS